MSSYTAGRAAVRVIDALHPTVSTDCRMILYVQSDEGQSDLMLVENYH